MSAPASSATTASRSTHSPVRLQAGDILMVVDVQRDFLPGGALGVTDGDAVVPVLNRYIVRFIAQGLPVVFTRDWHTPDHCSFHARGGPWPPHCVAGTAGAELHPHLAGTTFEAVFDKGEYAAAYSGFEGAAADGSSLAGWLRDRGVQEVDVCGIATDYCVKATALDAARNGFETTVLLDLTAAVAPANTDDVITEWASAGVAVETGGLR